MLPSACKGEQAASADDERRWKKGIAGKNKGGLMGKTLYKGACR